jgi:hypothetical protein
MIRSELPRAGSPGVPPGDPDLTAALRQFGDYTDKRPLAGDVQFPETPSFVKNGCFHGQLELPLYLLNKPG